MNNGPGNGNGEVGPVAIVDESQNVNVAGLVRVT